MCKKKSDYKECFEKRYKLYQKMCKEDIIFIFTPGRRQSKTPILLRNVDKKSIRTAFLIANGNQKHCFYRFLIGFRQLLLAFSIAVYPV